MSDKSAIEWTDATWNPTTGCDRVSPGCAHCYALDLAARLKRMGAPAYQVDGDPRTSGPGFGLQLHPERLELPLRWTRPRRIFVNSMSDLFHPEVGPEFVADVFAVMAIASQHTFQVLTKRPETMRRFLNHPVTWLDVNSKIWARAHPVRPGGSFWDHPIPNVWLGTSVENQRWTSRIDDLVNTPAAVRFLSCEPLLGPLDLTPWLQPDCDAPGIRWVIAGGESGPEHRPVDPDWIRSIRDQCVAADVPFLFKQWGGKTSKAAGRELDGRTWDEMPELAVPA